VHNPISRSISVALSLDTRTLQWLADALPQKVWLADAHGHPSYFNKQWSAYTGLTAEELTDGTWLQVLHPEDVASHYHAWQRALMTGVDALCEVRLRDKAGVYRWHSICGLAQRSAEGKILLWVSVCTDIDEQKRTEQTLKVSEKNVRRRDDLISMASHELKTPLAFLKMACTGSLDHPFLQNETQQENNQCAGYFGYPFVNKGGKRDAHTHHDRLYN
jgi:PAS domain S-box-containing protein